MSEVVAKWSPSGEGGFVAFDATDPEHWATLWEEVKLWFDGYDGEPGVPVGTITVEYVADGFLESLPEHDGW